MTKAIHYQNPAMPSPYHACGMGDRFKVVITTDREKVTCKRCLQTIAGQGNGGRPKSELKKQQLRTSLPLEAIEWLNAQPNKAKVIREAIVDAMNRQ
jgi:hypothetical protein